MTPSIANSKLTQWPISFIKMMMALIAFGLGGYIYLAYRSTSLNMFGWFKTFGLFNIVSHIRKHSDDTSLCYFVLYCLPDALWTTSYIIISDTIWQNNKRMQYIWASILPIIGLTSEIFQKTGIIHGTFDILDMLCYIIPYIIYVTYKSLQS